MPLKNRDGTMDAAEILRDTAKRKQSEKKTERRIAELATLNEIGRAIASTVELDELWKLIHEQASRVMEVSTFYISLYNRAENELTVVIDTLHGKRRRRNEGPRKFRKGRTEYIIRTGKPLLVRGKVQETYKRMGIVSTDQKAKGYAGVPITAGNRVIGVLAVQSYEHDDAYDEHTIELLSTIGSQAAIAIENARLYQEIKRMAITDGLTDLYNLRYFYEEIGKEILRSNRFQHPVSLVMLDLDDFKKYNDVYGHLAGDGILKELARILLGTARQTDFVARYGGEEFAIIMPETTKQDASTLAERLLTRLRVHPFPHAKVTASIGVATYPQDASSPKALVDAADKALLRAKRTGKNTVCIYPGKNMPRQRET